MQRVKDYVADFLFNGTIGLAVFFVLKFAYLTFTPTIWYFHYDSVTPVQTQPALVFESVLINKQEGNLIWNDVLRCLDQNGEFSYYSQLDTHASTIKSSDDYYSSIWTYTASVPEKGTCRLDTTVTRDLDFGVSKTQFLTSNTFDI